VTAIGGAGSRITAAAEGSHDGIAMCIVEGTLAPAIGFKVLLPTRTWTGRYLQVGCGGLCGRVSLQVGAADGCTPVTDGGFAIGSTDMGHAGMGGEFGQDPQKRADFAYRAVHLTAVLSKALVRAFYGRDADYAYFTGCSDGGREALMEAQRYPHDFDGIIAGAPAMNFQVQNGLFHAWQARSNQGPGGTPVLLAPRLPLLHSAVLEQCDRLDGQVDGLLADPRACHVDLTAAQCRGSEADGTARCLTPAEVEVARRFYDGPRDPSTGERLTAGGPQPGSELAWAGVFVPASASQPIFSERITLDALRNLSFETNPPASFGLSDVRFDRGWIDRLRPLHPLYDATNPDLAAFAAAGGKLILWHGWSDPHISPMNTIAYHDAVGAELGTATRDAFERMYLLPGVHHCSGGEGPSRIDLLTPMMAWVEQGTAPDAIVSRAAGRGPASGFGLPTAPPPGGRPPTTGVSLPRTASGGGARPVYPYPHIATWDGKGDPTLASSYVRGTTGAAAPVPAWAGSDFFRPYPPRER
jgi:feruloyl esterase